jgi:hypothetical protein
MRPTKRTQAVKKPRKIATKRAVRGKSRKMEIGTTETPLAKLMKLKYLINDAFNSSQENMGEPKSDKNWVMEEIDSLRNGGWLSATKMKVANEMWNKYGE